MSFSKILNYIHMEVNPTLDELIDKFGKNPVEILIKERKIFKYYDNDTGYFGEYRVVRDECFM